VTEINTTSVSVQKKALFWEWGRAYTFDPFLHFTGIPFQCNKKRVNYTLSTRHDKIGIWQLILVIILKLIFFQYEKETWLRLSKEWTRLSTEKKHYPPGSFTCFVNTYAVDSVLQPLDNRVRV